MIDNNNINNNNDIINNNNSNNSNNNYQPVSEINLSYWDWRTNTPSFLSNYINDMQNSKELDENKSLNKSSFKIDNYIELKELKGISSFSYINLHFICKKCLKIPIIHFISLTEMEYSCSCKDLQNIKRNLNEIIDKNIINIEAEDEDGEKKEDINLINIEAEDEEEEKKEDINLINIEAEDEDGEKKENINLINIENYLQCSKHKKNYNYYCEICKKNLCRECLRENDSHHKHNLFCFDLYKYETDEQKTHLEKILFTESNNFDFEKEIDPFFAYLLSVILNDYIYHPNYSHFKIITDAKNFLDNFISNKNNNKIIESFGIHMKINTKKELLENLKSNSKIITEIVIKKSNINDITEICRANLINLKKLELVENCIIDIKPLKYAKFENIEKINFEFNQIGNDNIPSLYELKFKKLIELNLEKNNITNNNIFQIKNFKDNLPNLERLFIGCNIID